MLYMREHARDTSTQAQEYCFSDTCVNAQGREHDLEGREHNSRKKTVATKVLAQHFYFIPIDTCMLLDFEIQHVHQFQGS